LAQKLDAALPLKDQLLNLASKPVVAQYQAARTSSST
jgi:hypothetical protein